MTRKQTQALSASEPLSDTAARLYEWCIQNAADGVTPWISVAQLYAVFRITKSHSTFASFNRSELKPAIAQIMQRARIRASFQRTGHVTSHVRFSFSKRPTLCMLAVP